MVKQKDLPFLVFVDEELNKVVGFRFMFPSTRFILPCEMPNTLDGSMFVDPEYQNIGLAKKSDDVIVKKYRDKFIEQGKLYHFGMSVNKIFSEWKVPAQSKLTEAVALWAHPNIWFSRGRFMNPLLYLSDFRVPSPRL
jgi:GNAT superfamily N-acetyltransferase